MPRVAVDVLYHNSGFRLLCGVVYHDSGSGAGEPCGVRAAIEANLRCIDQSCFFQTFFNPFLQTD